MVLLEPSTQNFAVHLLSDCLTKDCKLEVRVQIVTKRELPSQASNVVRVNQEKWATKLFTQQAAQYGNTNNQPQPSAIQFHA
jgi:hypothetical protein